VLTNTGTIAAATLIVKLCGLVKELLIAYSFGAGMAVDSFLIACVVPTMLINVASGAIRTSVVPWYVQLMHSQGADAARLALGKVCFWAFCLFAMLPLTMNLLGPRIPLLLSPARASIDGQTVRESLALLGLYVFFQLVSSLWIGVLNARESFFWPSLSELATSLLAIVAMLLLADDLGVLSVAIGLAAGSAAQAAWLCLLLCRRGQSPLPIPCGLTRSVVDLGRQFLFVLGGGVISTSSSLIDTIMAAPLGTGSVSLLNFGSRLVAVAGGLIVMTLNQAAYLQISKLIAANQKRALGKMLVVLSSLSLSVSLPLAIAIWWMSPLIIELTFQRGAFSAESTVVCAQVQSMAAWQLPCFVLGMMFIRVIGAFRCHHVVTVMGAICAALNVTLNLVLIPVFGVSGIALATSLAYLAACVGALVVAVRLIRRM
jgi:putative peptidoglycan lipid II flippase